MYLSSPSHRSLNGAQFLRMTDTGMMEPNKSADFLVLDANPLDDITNTRKTATAVQVSFIGLGVTHERHV
jgi:cytosine/adenosine deaminase-related metal-dependent hydrolase